MADATLLECLVRTASESRDCLLAALAGVATALMLGAESARANLGMRLANKDTEGFMATGNFRSSVCSRPVDRHSALILYEQPVRG